MGGIPIEAIKNKLDGIEDAVFKNIEIDKERVTLIYFSSLVDKLTLHQDSYCTAVAIKGKSITNS